MYKSELNFNKFAQEANEYANELAEKLGHPEEKQRAMIAWRAVMHTIRDRIQVDESFHLMSQLPMILKGIYTEDWKFYDNPPKQYETIEEMNKEIEKLQGQYGESQFNWNLKTEEITSEVIDSLQRYLDEGQLDHIRNQMPKQVQELV